MLTRTQASVLAQVLAAPPTLNLSYSQMTEAKKICKCPTVNQYTNYESYMRAKKARIVGCCCTGTTANLYNIYGPC
jgi:S-methylmethionine-dependent homocysteine/selenocysteine methylase